MVRAQVKQGLLAFGDMGSALKVGCTVREVCGFAEVEVRYVRPMNASPVVTCMRIEAARKPPDVPMMTGAGEGIPEGGRAMYSRLGTSVSALCNKKLFKRE